VPEAVVPEAVMPEPVVPEAVVPDEALPDPSPLTGWLDTLVPVPLASTGSEPDPEPEPEPEADAVSNDLADNRPGSADPPAPVRQRRSGVVRLSESGEELPDEDTRELAWRARSQQARKMGPRLEKHLSPAWRVLHSLPLGDTDGTVDHLLIGPGGVFTLSTHEHRDGRVWVSRHDIRINGERVPYIRPAIGQARRIGRLLSAASGRRVRVTPCLVIVTGSTHPDVVFQEPFEGVMVIDSSRVVRTFRELADVLTPDVVDRLFDAARRRSSWVIGGA
jgi:hypothetical protein